MQKALDEPGKQQAAAMKQRLLTMPTEQLMKQDETRQKLYLVSTEYLQQQGATQQELPQAVTKPTKQHPRDWAVASDTADSQPQPS